MWDSKNGSKASREKQEEFYKREKRKQAGIAFPSAGKQEHLLIIRFDTLHTPIEKKNREAIRAGLQRLCDFFERIDNGKFKMYHLFEDGDLKSVPLSDFNFSVTLGFGKGFFEKLGITVKNVPKKLKRIPNYSELGDQEPYTLFQTDFIIQLGSTKEDVNRYIFQNVTSTEQEEKGPNEVYNGYHGEQTDIYSIIADWAKITDIHEGFQRIDGRNLMGFNDGISNPSRLSNDVVWTSKEEEDQKFNDGSYMVFLKIEHDLEKWRKMSVEHQEEWIGRRKETGLLLGTMSREQDQTLASDLKSDDPVIRQHAFKVWKRFYDEQKDPEKKFFDINQTQFKSIQAECPVWSHIRKSNPRQADGAARSLIFRRGYLFANGGLGGKFDSGLLFICFQKDIENGFEYIMKNFLHNKNFPVPDFRRFNSEELKRRQKHGRFTELEIKKGMTEIKLTHDPDAQNTGEEGLSGPSELGVYSRGEFSVTRTLGGGYYFIPPIPHKKISEISEQFFD